MKVHMQTVFVLGARDPEMDFIRRFLQENDLNFMHACVSGDRVDPGSAYPSANGDGPTAPTVKHHQVWIECAPPGGKELLKEMGIPCIDHHHPGDPGYDVKPEDHHKGSSIGQLHAMLGMELSSEARLVSAIDHCVNAAYRKECPDIDVDALFEYQIQGICKRTGKPREIIAEKIDQYQRILSVSPPKPYKTRAGVCYVHEFLKTTLTTFWEFLCFREAALADRATAAVLTQFKENGCSPERKLMVVGHPTPDFIERFTGGTDLYPTVKNRFGVPVRGYCGGYPEPEEKKGCLYVGRGVAYETMMTHLMGDDFVKVGSTDDKFEVKIPIANCNNTYQPWTFCVRG